MLETALWKQFVKMLTGAQSHKKPSEFEIHVADPIKQGEGVAVSCGQEVEF